MNVRGNATLMPADSVALHNHKVYLLAYVSVPLVFVLSLLGSSWHAPWIDEAFTLWASQLNLSSFIDLIQQTDVVYALYYFLIGAWLDLFGSTLWTARLFSAVAMATAAAGVVFLARRLGDPVVAMISGLVFALLPIVSASGMVARPPAMATALVTWATVAFVQTVQQGAPRAGRSWIVYALVLICAGYTFLFSLLIVPAHATTLALIRAPAGTWRNFLKVLASVTVAMIPLVLVALGQRGGLGHYRPPSIQAIAGIPFIWTTSRIAGTLLWLIVVIGLIKKYRDQRRERATGILTGIEIPGFALPWLLLPVSILTTVSMFYPVFSYHYVTFSSPALALLVGYTSIQLRPRWIAGMILVVAMVAAIPAYVSARSPDGGDGWGLKRQVLVDQIRPGDGLLTDPDWYHRIALVDPIPGVVILQHTGERLDKIPENAIEKELDAFERVWLIPRRSRDSGGPSASLLEKSGFGAVECFEADTTLILYKRPEGHQDDLRDSVRPCSPAND
jgi:mannosyltransferase